MAIFSIEIADQDVERVIEALCLHYGREETITDPDNAMDTIPNPESKPVFANRMVRKFLQDHVRKYDFDIIRKQIDTSNNIPIINDPQL
tara:strand:+ start:638 stop:904 length:267 start_codon:yes stop_codon:yes gene_type:complete